MGLGGPALPGGRPGPVSPLQALPLQPQALPPVPPCLPGPLPATRCQLPLALFLTLFVMNPVFEAMYAQGWVPYAKKEIVLEEALDRGSKPLKAFMVAHTRDSDLQLFSRLSKLPLTDRESAPLRVDPLSHSSSSSSWPMSAGRSIARGRGR